MNTWGYIVLIAALALLAGFMVYVRLRMRAKEKSLHHTPVESQISMVADENVPDIRAAETEPTAEAEAVIDDAVQTEDVSPREVEVIATPVSEKKADPSRKEESDYIDELQEAAAGLAALMRSSPVSRTQPVVFAPEEEDVENQELGIAEVQGEISEEVLETPVDGDVEAREVEVVVSEEVPKVEEEELVETEEASETTLSEILGEEISGQFDLIDDGLNALEDLVVGLESSLARLEPVEDDWEDISFEAEAA